MLSCLHGKEDTTISCMCVCSFGSAQCSGCVVYGPGIRVGKWPLFIEAVIFFDSGYITRNQVSPSCIVWFAS